MVRDPSAGGTQGPPVLRAPPPGAGNKGRLLTSRREREQRALTHITSGTGTKSAYSHHVTNGNKGRLLTSRHEREQRAPTHITSETGTKGAYSHHVRNKIN